MGEESFDQAPVEPGEVLASKYRVERVLGVGGMGVVVAATHLELGQPVALKFLLPKAAQRPDYVHRFLKEARATVRLTTQRAVSRTSPFPWIPGRTRSARTRRAIGRIAPVST